jgi:Predicted membrane protein (DUF2142)
VTRSSDARRWAVWLSATAAFAIIGCTWALATARYGGPDEPAHVTRSSAAADGDLLGKPVTGFEPGYRQVAVPAALASGDPACFRHDEYIAAECARPTAGSNLVEVATSAGAAPPWYYVVVGGIANVLSDGGSVMAYRMAALLLSALILGYALMRAGGFGGGTWLIVAFTPSAWFLLGVVGTSGVEIALIALAMVEAVARFHSEEATASLLRVSVPLAACLILRPAALIDIAVVALILMPTLPRPITARRVAALVIPLAIAGAASLAWSRWTGLVVSDKRTADSYSLTSALSRSLKGMPLTIHQAIGAFGWNEFYAPPVAQLLWIATLAFAAWWVTSRMSGHWWYVRWIVAALLLPTILEVAVHTRIGEIWQGRYSIPFAMGGVLYAGRGGMPRRSIVQAILGAAAVAEVLSLWQTLRRYMVGLDGSLTLRDASWTPPLNPWLLLVMNAAAITWLATECLRPDREGRKHSIERGQGTM